MNVIRTQDQILERFNQSDDFMGIQAGDLIEYMDYEVAKPHLKQEYIQDVESGKEAWQKRTDPLQEIVDYLPFAFEKAHGQRGLSAARSMLHMKTWIWLCDDEFYKQIVDSIDNYCDYGLPVLEEIQGWVDKVSKPAADPVAQ